MKNNLITYTLALVVLGTAAQAAPFLAIGDGAELFVTGTLGVRADDNIFLTAKADRDVIFDLTPGAQITFGKDAALKGSLTLVDSFSNYADNSKLNTNLVSADFVSSYSDGKLKLGFNAGFHELNQNAPDIRGLTRRDVFSTGVKGEAEVSEITSLSAGVTFTHTNYKRAGYGDSDDYVVPINFYYKWTEKVELSVGYRYRDYQTQIGQDSTDHYLNVGARGKFSPKLTGEFTVGVTERKLAKGGDETMLGLDANLTYEISPKTNLELRAANAPDTSPQGQQQKNFSLGGTVTTNLTEQWSVNGGLSYRGINYTTRTDDYIEGQLGANYAVNAYVKLVGAYVYRHNGSVLKSGEFTNNVFSLAASVRY